MEILTLVLKKKLQLNFFLGFNCHCEAHSAVAIQIIMPNQRSIFKDSIAFLLKPKKTLSSILDADEFVLEKKLFIFITVMHLYSLFVPSTLIFLLILVIPFILITIGFVYFFSQELSILYSETKGKEFLDLFLYRIAYCLSLLALPSMFISIMINIFFLVRADNFLLAAVLSLAFEFIPLLVLAWYLNMFLGLISSGRYGLLKLIELMFISLISTLKAKFGWEAVSEIMIDLKNLNSA